MNVIKNLDEISDLEELKKIERVYFRLSQYTEERHNAIMNRARGEERLAQVSDNRCKAIYKWLPDWAKW